MAAKTEEDWVVPLPRPVVEAKTMRSTWLISSLAALRQQGHGARYDALLAPAHREALAALVAAAWVPMAVARAHYAACDGLDLKDEELYEIGANATRRANATQLAFVARIARGSGVTPWTVLSQIPRFWERTFEGGGIGVLRLGPKEARIQLVGFPLAAMRYTRASMTGIVRAFLELFCEKVYVKDLPSFSDSRSLGLRVSWV